MSGKRFCDICLDVLNRVSRISNYLGDNIDVLIMEYPPPNSNFSAGLYALDTALSLVMRTKTREMYCVTPNYCKHILKLKKASKTQSVIMGKKLVELLKKYYTVEIDGRLSADKSEALIIMSRVLFKVDKRLRGELLELSSNYSNSKEIKMFT